MSLNHAGNQYAARLAAQSRTPTDQKVEAKIYYHQFNYAKFHFDFGGSHVKTVQFANFRYITDDKREQDQLELVADMPGTYIYTIPDSDVAAALQQELQQEAIKTIQQTALATAQVHNQQFDPSTPIVPVNVQHLQATPGLQVSQIPRPASSGYVGTQNSLSGTSTTEGTGPAFTKSSEQVAPPNAAAEAMARLDVLTKQAQDAGSQPT